MLPNIGSLSLILDMNFNSSYDDIFSLSFNGWNVLLLYEYRDFDGKVTPEEVAAAATYLKNTLGKEGVQELLGSLSKDKGIQFVSIQSLRTGSLCTL